MNYGLVKNLVGGELVAAGAGDTIDITDPATDGTSIGQVPAMTEHDLAEVFAAAEKGAVAWKAVGQIERGKVLTRAAYLLREHADELAALIVSEMGKTRAEADGEVAKSAEFFEYYGGLGRLPYGDLLPDGRAGTFAMQVHEPLGVVVLITPWNDPLMTPARKLGPALLAGNAVVLKPATDSPLIALRLAGLLHGAGLPAGALGTVTGRGSQIGDSLVAHRSIKAVSFTGSTDVGLRLQRTLAGRSVRVQTEMGGKNAAVVLDDADLDIAVPAIMLGAFAQSGQRCTSTSRLIVQKGIEGELRKRVGEAVAALKVAGGTSEGVNIGPVVNTSAKEQIGAHVATALDEGAEIIARSPLGADEQRTGAFVEPLFIKVSPDAQVWRDEVFGPVLSMIVVDTFDEAIERVNASSYGLSSAVFTTNLDSAYRFIDAVDTGQVSVNQPTSGWDLHQGFGGFKESGSPFKEQGIGALGFYTRIKTAAIRTR